MADTELDPYDFHPADSDDEAYHRAHGAVASTSGAFAMAGNVPNCLEYIEAAASRVVVQPSKHASVHVHGKVTVYGVSGKIAAHTPEQGLVEACNVIYSLLQRLQQYSEQAEKTDEQLVLLNHSLKMAKQANTNLQNAVQCKEREMGSLKNQVTATVSTEVQARDKLLAERKDLQRRNVDLESKAKKLQTELKRKEQELAKVNGKLREVLESKGNAARHQRQLTSNSLAMHSRTGSMSSIRSDGSELANVTESRIQTLKDTYEAKYRELYNKHTDLQTAYSRLQETYKNLLFQQLRKSAKKENVRMAANDGNDDDS